MKKQKSLRCLAGELEISPAYLSMILSGQRNPNTQLREKLCSLGMLISEQIEARMGAHNPKVVRSNRTPATTHFDNNLSNKSAHFPLKRPSKHSVFSNLTLMLYARCWP